MTLWFTNGETRTYRIISSMTKSGFVLSPMVRTTVEFIDLVSGNQSALKSSRVKAAKIWSDIPLLPIWKPTFKITYSSLNPERYQEPNSLFSPMIQIAKQTNIATIDNCLGVIDYVNGQLLRGKQTVGPGKYLTLTGWLISPVGDMNKIPPQVLVEVTDDDGQKAFYEAQRTPRADVKAHFKHPNLPDVGYAARISLSEATTTYTVTIAAKEKNSVKFCKNLRVEVQP